MQIELKSLQIEGFGSFGAPQTFKFDYEPGLYFISGPNGSGKTTLSDALSWVYYDKTALGVQGPAVESWLGNPCQVSLSFLVDGQKQIITRTQGPKSLSLNNHPIVNDDVIRLLGINHDQFLIRVIVGQLVSSFLELPPRTQLDLFSTILKFFIWEEASDLANTKSQALQKDISKTENEIAGVRAKLETLETGVASLKQKELTYDTDKQLQIVELKNQIVVASATFDLNQAKLETLKQDLRSLQLHTASLSSELEEQYKSLAELKDELNVINQHKTKLQTERTQLTSEYKKWQNIEGVCPYCTQSIGPDLPQKEKCRIASSLSVITEKLAVATLRQETIQKAQTGLEQAQETSKAGIRAGQQKERDLNTSIVNQTALVETNNSDIKQLIQQVTGLYLAFNPHTDHIQEQEKLITETRIQLSSLSKTYEQGRGQYNDISYWVQGYKDLRLWLSASALKALAMVTNSTLSKLGLPSWKLEFIVERTTTKGTLSRGMNTLVHHPLASKPIPFKLSSGGEKQRLKLATIMGLGFLIEAYSGFSCNVEFWDEPSSYLTNDGIHQLITILAERAIQENKQIFFIDHRALESPQFKHIIQVENTKNGTVIN